jgi:hypothetical protein
VSAHQRLARSYAGKWVAVHAEMHEVLASGDTAAAVYQQATQAGIEEPLIINVQDDYGSCVPCVLA